MARPRKYSTHLEAEEANRIKTRERKQERNRLRRHAKLAMQALTTGPNKPLERAQCHRETQSLSEAMTPILGVKPKSLDTGAITEQLVQ
jgi:hypothetical protein